MPPTITNSGNLISLVAGHTEVTVGMATAYGAIAIAGATLAGTKIATWRHWRQVQKVGHYDHGVDKFCAGIVGMTEPERLHCEEWTATDRERFRVAVVAAKEAGQPVDFKWKPVRGKGRELEIVPLRGGGYRITALQGVE